MPAIALLRALLRAWPNAARLAVPRVWRVPISYLSVSVELQEVQKECTYSGGLARFGANIPRQQKFGSGDVIARGPAGLVS